MFLRLPLAFVVINDPIAEGLEDQEDLDDLGVADDLGEDAEICLIPLHPLSPTSATSTHQTQPSHITSSRHLQDTTSAPVSGGLANHLDFLQFNSLAENTAGPCRLGPNFPCEQRRTLRCERKSQGTPQTLNPLPCPSV